MSTLHIGDGCAVGAAGIVLYDSEMERGSRLGPLSLLMKGESLLPPTSWVGIPAQQDVVGSDADWRTIPMNTQTHRDCVAQGAVGHTVFSTFSI